MTKRLVLLPGSLCDERLFTSVIAQLGADAPEWAVSVGDLSGDSSIEAMAESVLAQHDGRIVVAGLSLGGIVAAEMFHRAPERMQGVALIDTNLAMPDGRQLETRAAWANRTRAGEFTSMVSDDFIAPMTVDIAEHGPLIFDMAYQMGAKTFLQQNEALLHRRDRREDLAAATVPVLVACGREDRVCPPHIHADLADRIPGSQLVEVDGAGHLCTIDQPQALTNALVVWLARCADNINITHRGRTQ